MAPSKSRRTPATSACCRRAPPKRCARCRSATASSRAGELDRISPKAHRLRAEAARARPQQLGAALADRAIAERTDGVFGGAAADGYRIRFAARAHRFD